MNYLEDPDEMIREAVHQLKKIKLVKLHDLLIFIMGRFEGNYPSNSLIIKQIS
jgi:hypothetical protein